MSELKETAPNDALTLWAEDQSQGIIANYLAAYDHA